ncbi:MAG: hypothetical protein ACJA1H_000764 [Glaciecola sp.]|jgi:hypothetical protein
MQNLITFSLVCLFTITPVFSQVQTCDCKTDLNFIVEKTKKMPSYKKQIKGDKEIQFENLYATLSAKMEQPVLAEDCYKMLLKQMSVINDVHASLRFNHTYLSNDDINIESKLAAFKTSAPS